MTRVLIVDDKAENIYYLEALLTSSGCVVDSARHGAEALVKARMAPPDLVVADLLMPVMDGYTLLRHWKADARLRLIPFVVYTATYTEAADERLALDLGADAFILKPCEPQDLLARLRQVQDLGAHTAPITPARQPLQPEPELLKTYSETLIRKLEKKSLQLQEANAALQRDIAERQVAQENLRRSEALLSVASRLGRLGAWVIAMPSRTLTWSQEVRAIHEVPADFMPSVEEALDFYAPEHRPLIAQAFTDCVNSARPFDLELQLVLASGRRVWVRAIGEAQVGASGAVQQVQGAIQDITERKQLEEQVRTAQKMEALGTLAGGVAHDFNNVLGVIRGHLHLAQRALEADHPAARSLREIGKASEHARNLVQQILTFSRQQPVSRRLLAVGPAVHETAELLRVNLPAGIELEVNVAAGTPAVMADATQLHQVLLNLGTNAWQAMGSSGRLTLSAEGVTLDESAQAQCNLAPGDYVCISVSDTGHGMDEATLERIFNPFFTTKAPGQGTGLGLSVVDGIVREHEGAIRVVSQPGRGTTFRVYLPAVHGQPVDPEADSPAPALRGVGQHLLYLDDNEALVDLTAAIFGDLGYRVSGFTDAEECIAAFSADPSAFDLVITDLNMPNLSGLEVASRLRALRPGLRVILISGFINEALLSQALELGVADVIDKTSSVEEMAQTIHALLLRG